MAKLTRLQVHVCVNVMEFCDKIHSNGVFLILVFIVNK